MSENTSLCGMTPLLWQQSATSSEAEENISRLFREECEGNGGCLLKEMGVLTESGQFSMSGDEWDRTCEHS
jgi:hypothetical protein